MGLTKKKELFKPPLLQASVEGDENQLFDLLGQPLPAGGGGR